jgi:predicted ATPase
MVVGEITIVQESLQIMKITKLMLREFGILRNVNLRPADLVILFGANGVGKTTLLDALERAMDSKPLQQQLGFSRSEDGQSFIEIHFSAKDMEEEEVKEIYRSYLFDNPWNEPSRSLTVQLNGREGDVPRSLEELEAAFILKLSADLVPSGDSIAMDFVSELARNWSLVIRSNYLAGTSAWTIYGEIPCSRVDQFLDQLDGDEDSYEDGPLDRFGPDRVDVGNLFDESWRDVEFTDHLSIPIVDFAREVVRELGMQVSGFNRAPTNYFVSTKPTVIRLDDALETLESQIEKNVFDLANKILDFPGDSYEVNINSRVNIASGPGMKLPKFFDQPHFDSGDTLSSLGRRRWESKRTPQLTWLERIRSSDGEEDSFDRSEGQESYSSHFRIAPPIVSAVERVEDHVNSLLPSFISSEYRLCLEILAVELWSEGVPRIRLFLRGNNELRIPLALSGSGIRKWCSLALKIACHELLEAKRIDPLQRRHYGGKFWIGLDIDPDAVESVQLFWSDANEILLEPDGSRTIILIDEPEAHLHPNAVRSIAKWISDTSSRCMHVFVASHHPVILNLSGPQVQRVLVIEGNYGSKFVEWDKGASDISKELANTIGITVGDLVLQSNYFLFVEGHHDAIVLEEFFGPWFREYGIRIFPLHGLANVEHLATAEVVWALDVPCGVLADNISGVVKIKSREQHLLERLQREAEIAGHHVDQWGLTEQDILRYLSEDLIASNAIRTFPGWRVFQEQYDMYKSSDQDTKKGKLDWKRWLTREYGVDLSLESVRRIARACRIGGQIPEEIAELANELIKNLESRSQLD